MRCCNLSLITDTVRSIRERLKRQCSKPHLYCTSSSPYYPHHLCLCRSQTTLTFWNYVSQTQTSYLVNKLARWWTGELSTVRAFPKNCAKYDNQTQPNNAPVKVNPDPQPPKPGICGALVGLYHHICSSLSPQYVGNSRVLSLLSWGMWGISRGFVLIQDGGDRSRKDLWVRLGTLERTQVFTGICGIRFTVIQINT